MDPALAALIAFLVACVSIIALTAIVFGHKDIAGKALDLLSRLFPDDSENQEEKASNQVAE